MNAEVGEAVGLGRETERLGRVGAPGGACARLLGEIHPTRDVTRKTVELQGRLAETCAGHEATRSSLAHALGKGRPRVGRIEHQEGGVRLQYSEQGQGERRAPLGVDGHDVTGLDPVGQEMAGQAVRVGVEIAVGQRTLGVRHGDARRMLCRPPDEGLDRGMNVDDPGEG